MNHHKLNLVLFLFFIIAMTGFMIFEGIGITPDRYIFVLIPLSLLVKRTRRFLLDWLPFLFILISYDFFRSFAYKLNPRVIYLPQINFDKWLFGEIPNITLQNIFYRAGEINWYDYLATITYFLHFALPLAFGFMLWLKNREYFKKFIISLLLLSYAAFFTYVLFPASPPWLSAKLGIMPPIVKILDITLLSFPDKLHLPSIYHNFDPNLVAAIPSLHAAYPFLVFLLSWEYFKKKRLFFGAYMVVVWVSLVYLGEHFVFDIIIGALYALAAYYFVKLSPFFKQIQEKNQDRTTSTSISA